MLAESPQNADVLVTLRSFDAALQSAPAHDVEVILAFLAITTAERVKEGLVSPAEADRLLTLIDVHLTDSKRAQELSEEPLELITEGGDFKHYGERDGSSPEASPHYA